MAETICKNEDTFDFGDILDVLKKAEKEMRFSSNINKNQLYLYCFNTK